MLTFNDINKGYNGHAALDSISFSIQKEKTTILIGPSGCGKSTILKLVAGLIQADSGSVSIDGQDIRTEMINRLRHRIGYVIQDGGLFPHLNAMENITLVAKYLKWHGDRISTRLQELSRLFRFPETLFKRYPHELSGGQQQRISLMRALMLDPDLLLMDEPLGALDPMIRYDLQRELKDIFQELKKTVLLVTHDMGEAAFLGDEIIIMREGRLVQQGELQDLLERPREAFVGEFIHAQSSHWALLGQGA